MSGVKLRAVSKDSISQQHDLICDTSQNNSLLVINEHLKTIFGLTALVKNEDTQHSTSDPMMPISIVRNDTTASLVSTDGDYTPLQCNSDGRLVTKEEHSTIINSNIAALKKEEDAAHSSGDSGIMSLVVRKDTMATLSSNDGDYTSLQCNNTGALRVESYSKPLRAYESVTTDSNGNNLVMQLDPFESTAGVDVRDYNHYTLVYDSAETTAQMELWVSHNNTSYTLLEKLNPRTMSGGYVYKEANITYSYFRIRNPNDTFKAFSGINVYKST